MTAYAERRDIIADRNTDGTVALQRVKDQLQIVDMAGYLIGLIQAVRSILGKIASGFARLSQLRPTVDPLRPVIAVKKPVQRVCICASRVCKRGNKRLEQIILRLKSCFTSPAAEPEHIGRSSCPAEVGIRRDLTFRNLCELLFRVDKVNVGKVEVAVLQRAGRQFVLHLFQR